MNDESGTGYTVLARKYRPETLADLVGQDAMVRTLRNAFSADRIAQAFIMTGIRGTGKTTTARIIAKGLNCIGPDGQGGPTTEPCGECAPCRQIMAGRFMDVLEMDAASNTGVDYVRELTQMANTRPAEGRFKIFIIDEVHMLSTSAFNALLKTLEEPPPHTKFILATTEIRKVPVTVLSRCQRFDLRRIEPEEMMGLLRRIAEAEGAAIADDALALITRAAEGSARDATSLLDQAISPDGGETTAEEVRAMLGLADRGRVLDLAELILRGDAAGALAELSAQYADGADPLAVLRDLAEITHWVSVVKITPEAAQDPTVSPDEQARGLAMSEALPMRVLSRMWQMLLKALEEVAIAPNPMMAAEMAVIRLTHVAELPTPEELVRKLQGHTPPPGPGGGPGSGARRGDGADAGRQALGPAAGGTPADTGPSAASPGDAQARSRATEGRAPPSAGAAAVEARNRAMAAQPQSSGSGGGPTPALAQDPAQALARFPTFDSVVALIRANRDVKLLVEVETGLRLAAYRPGRIEFTPADAAPPDLAQRLGQRLQGWTGNRWAVTVVNGCDAPTIAERRDADDIARRAEAETHPLVLAVLETFPKARITAVRSRAELAQQAEAEALELAEEEALDAQEAEDGWDPFER